MKSRFCVPFQLKIHLQCRRRRRKVGKSLLQVLQTNEENHLQFFPALIWFTSFQERKLHFYSLLSIHPSQSGWWKNYDWKESNWKKSAAISILLKKSCTMRMVFSELRWCGLSYTSFACHTMHHFCWFQNHLSLTMKEIYYCSKIMQRKKLDQNLNWTDRSLLKFQTRNLQEEFKSLDSEFLEFVWVPSQMMMVSGCRGVRKCRVEVAMRRFIIGWLLNHKGTQIMFIVLIELELSECVDVTQLSVCGIKLNSPTTWT